MDEERRARAARKGMWRGAFVAPWDWLRGKRLRGAERTSRPSGKATSKRRKIKGNSGRGGKRIYHMPGGRHYMRTRIDPSRGERWFCSKREALAAGWRRARR